MTRTIHASPLADLCERRGVSAHEADAVIFRTHHFLLAA